MISQKLDLKFFKISGSEFGALFLEGKLQGCIGIDEEDKGLSYIPCLFCSFSLCEMKKKMVIQRTCDPINSEIHEAVKEAPHGLEVASIESSSSGLDQ